MKTFATAASLVLLLGLPAFAGGRVGDQWVGRRGDQNPGTTYNAMTATHTGRLVAVGAAGMLMISDDGGSTWTFRTMTTSAGAVAAGLNDIQEFAVSGGSQKRLAVIAAELTDPSVVDSNITTLFPWADWAARTTLYLSDDDGQTWAKHPFPYGKANFGGRDYYGVDLTGLHVAPNGQLLAFGTTTLATQLLLRWSSGGLIYRSDDGVNWTLAEFGLGPLTQIADAGGRAVAVGATTAFDTVDGAGWNGYRMRDAVLSVPGSAPLDAHTSDRLRLLDVAYQSGTYVAHAVTYVPFDASLGIDSSTVDERFYLESASPFGAGRTWTAHAQTSDHGEFLPSTTGLLGFDIGVQHSLDNGKTWTMVDATVLTRTRTVARINPTTICALGSSATAWKSVNDGAGWTKVWNAPTGADMRLMGSFGGTVLAFGSNSSDLYASSNDGVDWSLRATGLTSGLAVTQTGNRLVMAKGSATSARTSDDGGATWQERTVDAASIASAAGILTTKTGRVVIAAEGKDVQNEGKFYVSDDAGVTWLPRSIHSTWQETPRAFVCTPTGRLITVTNTFALFNPRIVRSDDDGETWTGDTQLQHLDGLSTVTGDPSTKVFEAVSLLSDGGTGLVMAGKDAIVYSKDDGTTWTVAVHLAPPYDQFLTGTSAGGRMLVLGRKKDAANNWRHFTMTSDDGGATWRETPIPINQSNTFLLWATRGVGDRVIVSGTNAAVYTSDGQTPASTAPTGLTVREGNVLTIDVPRPPIPGAVSVRYSAVQGTALANADFTPLGGQLDWTDTEVLSKQVQLTTVDDTSVEPSEQLTIQLVYDNGTVMGTSAVPVTVQDDDGLPAGIQLVDPANLYTTESGGSATLLVALNKKSTADVTLTISGADATEGTLSTTTMTFTPLNWNVQQSLVVTGVDDATADGDVAYALVFTPSSADAAYSALSPARASIVNVDDESPPTSGGGVVFKKGSVNDKAKALKDTVSLSGTFAVLGKTFTPAAVAGSFSFGDPASPVRVDFTANDARWKHKKNKWTWTSAKGVAPHAVVTIDAVKGTFTVAVSKLDLAAAPATGFLASLNAGGQSGGGTLVFVDRKKGRFRYP